MQRKRESYIETVAEEAEEKSPPSKTEDGAPWRPIVSNLLFQYRRTANFRAMATLATYGALALMTPHAMRGPELPAGSVL
jgi:hypothetical protein